MYNIKLYDCYHKQTRILKNDIVYPIQVGKQLSNIKLDMQGDNTGDNISEKNPFYNELAGTYWIWKNVKADIVGVFHYRRYLNFINRDTKEYYLTDNILQKYGICKNQIKNIMGNCDIIVPQKTKKTKVSIYEYYKKEHIINDLDVVIDIVKKMYPSKVGLINTYFYHNSQMYVGNILISKKEIFDIYAKWLFDILFEVEKQIQNGVSLRNDYQQRVYGFLAERLTGLFLQLNPQYAVKEVPMLFILEDAKKWKKYKMRRLRKKILNILTFGLFSKK